MNLQLTLLDSGKDLSLTQKIVLSFTTVATKKMLRNRDTSDGGVHSNVILLQLPARELATAP